ncbi:MULTISPECIES: hypothetical protein [Sulfurimonas]|uniref:hypothetical protein n=1 Tax=Sulfurimonas TaxID=202746 RepID=UPI00165F8B7F|nr:MULTISPECIES: hypothetical protein [Sulfurimonas]
MKDFKLKLVLTALSAIVFSFIFILLAFALPIHKKEEKISIKPKGKLEQISHSLKNR